ncbi:MAG TPA: hypothetical protein VMH88_06070 [Gemmatimonadales bacterium]|nr:hypothetical protein [Gemmatimonadales bacterium]
MTTPPAPPTPPTPPTPPSPPSGTPLGMADFFALEAGEYLERLDALLAPAEPPAADEFVRLARALRGSALMANQQAIARAAAGLEALARGVREGRRAWDSGTQQLAIRGVDDLKIFLRRVAGWTDADTAKAEALGRELEQQSGRPSAQLRAAEALGLDAGARAFVAREGAAIASTLDRVATSLRGGQTAKDAFPAVLRALQPLRGLAALNDLPPLPDLLEGIEGAITELQRTGVAAHQGAAAVDLFQSAATAIAQAAREVAERGRPDADAPVFRTFAERLVAFLEREPGVVPITSLYFNDAGPHIVKAGTPAAAPEPMSQMELVSHGDHLRQAADALERAPSATQRELRAHTLAGTLRGLVAGREGPFAARVGEFVRLALEAVAGGLATREPIPFATELRKAGAALSRASTDAEAALSAELTGVNAALQALIHPGAPPSQPSVVPIESLAPTPPAAAAAPPPAPPAPPAVEPAPDTADLAGSWSRYQRMVGAGVGPASLDELLAGASAAAPPSRDTGRPSVPVPSQVPTAPGEPSVVDIRTLLYRGQRALARAHELREQARRASPDRLQALIDEVCDLVALALEPSPNS